MARPIRNTPILYGKDARRFLADISKLPSNEDRKRERERVRNNVVKLKEMIASCSQE